VKTKETQKMFVAFKLSNSEVLFVPAGRAVNSRYIQDIMSYSSCVEIIIPNKYSTIIYNYVDFLNGNKVIIDDVHYLISCFDMYTYFDDNEYFGYLAQQLYSLWSPLSTSLSLSSQSLPSLPSSQQSNTFMWVLNSINPVVSRQVLLQCPHDMLPVHCRNDKLFFSQWLLANTNTTVTLNNGQTYHSQYTQCSPSQLLPGLTNDANGITHSHVLTIRHIVDYNTEFKTVLSYYDNGNLACMTKFENGVTVGRRQYLNVSDTNNFIVGKLQMPVNKIKTNDNQSHQWNLKLDLSPQQKSEFDQYSMQISNLMEQMDIKKDSTVKFKG